MLSPAFAGDTLGHAYLFCGEDGVGKFAAALDLALALLCTHEGAEIPCLQCSACLKVLRNNHPDFHVIVPVSMEKEHKSSDGSLSKTGWDYLSSTIAGKIESPYMPLSYSGVPTIPVEWIKEVTHAIQRGAVSGLRNVTIMSGIDIMNKESANAMLKTLEEPPPNTFVFLTTNRPEAVLPTIASRCQILRFGHVPANDIKIALAGSIGDGISEANVRRAVQYAAGSLGRALLLAATDLDESISLVKHFWGMCLQGNMGELAIRIDDLAKHNDYEAHKSFFTSMMYLIRNSFLQKSGCSENYIDASDILDDPRGIFENPQNSEKLSAACASALSGVAAYGNIAIILVNFVMTITEICNGQQQ